MVTKQQAKRLKTCGWSDESAEQLFEPSDDLLLDLQERSLGVQLSLEARHPVLPDAAWCDPVEPREVGLDVQGEAVGGDATGGELHADGGDLVSVYPDPRVL